MAGRALGITQRQVEALCKGAAKAGMRPEIKINGVVVRLVPDEDRAKKIDDDSDIRL